MLFLALVVLEGNEPMAMRLAILALLTLFAASGCEDTMSLEAWFSVDFSTTPRTAGWVYEGEERSDTIGFGTINFDADVDTDHRIVFDLPTDLVLWVEYFPRLEWTDGEDIPSATGVPFQLTYERDGDYLEVFLTEGGVPPSMPSTFTGIREMRFTLLLAD